jgi:pyruvate formate lyase activating enzyme
MIAAVERCSFVDFPGRLAAVAFTQGCNLRCRYCHNPELCGRRDPNPEVGEEFLQFLAGRRGLLSGVVICGGEPMLWPGIRQLLLEIRAMGFAVKLDTNGTWPEQTQRLVDAGLVDYLAVDIKAPPGERSAWLCGCEGQADRAVECLAYAVAKHVACEARTVLVRGVHDDEGLSWIAQRLADHGIMRWRLRDVRAGRVLDTSVVLKPPERVLVRQAVELARSLALEVRGPV